MKNWQSNPWIMELALQYRKPAVEDNSFWVSLYRRGKKNSMFGVKYYVRVLVSGFVLKQLQLMPKQSGSKDKG